MSKKEAKILVELEKAVKKREKEISAISDPGERLLEYNDLSKSLDSVIDKNKLHYQRFGAILRSSGYYNKAKVYAQNGALAGQWIAGPAGIAAGVTLGIFVLSPALGVGLAAAAGFGIFVGVTAGFTLLAAGIGKAIARLKSTPESRHSNRLFSVKQKVDASISGLTENNINGLQDILVSSEKVGEVKAAFPNLKSAFTSAEKSCNDRRALLGLPPLQTVPTAPPPGAPVPVGPFAPPAPKPVVAPQPPANTSTGTASGQPSPSRKSNVTRQPGYY